MTGEKSNEWRRPQIDYMVSDTCVRSGNTNTVLRQSQLLFGRLQRFGRAL